MGCKSESFRWVSRLGTLVSVAKFGHFELTPLAESFFRKVFVFREKNSRSLLVFRVSLARSLASRRRTGFPVADSHRYTRPSESPAATNRPSEKKPLRKCSLPP